MNFTKVMDSLKDASPFELYRLSTALRIEMENPSKIEALSNSFAVGDKITYFNNNKNTLCPAIVLEKHSKRVVVKDLSDGTSWRTPYYAINITEIDSDIHVNRNETLTKNHLSIGESVGFMHEGKQYTGRIVRLNLKTVSLIIPGNHKWRVAYEFLFKVLEGEYRKEGEVHQLENGSLLIEGN